MELMLAALVFLSAVVLLFAKEFEAVIHKIAAIPGIKLTLPLLFASFIVEQYDAWCVWFLLACQEQLGRVIQAMIALLPFKSVIILAGEVILLFIIACIPAVFIWVIKRKATTFRPIVSPFYMGSVLWIIAAFLLITIF